ncbi:MAG: reverse transcriptase family protein [Patescibacteria group bacterium]
MYPTEWRLNIETVGQLAQLLGYSKRYLLSLAARTQYLYREKPIAGRTLSIPAENLKNVQRTILHKLFHIEFPHYVHGGIQGRSIITNALPHRQKGWVSCLDIKKFFPSTHFKKVRHFYEELGCHNNVADCLTRLTTYDYQLPQGAPTSPVLANMILWPVDQRIFKLCKARGYTYTRFFDDMTISGTRNPNRLFGNTSSILKNNGYELNMHKRTERREQAKTSEQIVCGIKVNDKNLDISAEMLKRIKRSLGIYGQGNFDEEYRANPAKTMESLRSLIDYIKSINTKTAQPLLTQLHAIEWPHS